MPSLWYKSGNGIILCKFVSLYTENLKCNFPMCLGLWQIGRKEGDFGRPKRLRQAWILGGIEVWNLDCVCMQIGTATNRLQIESHGYARIPFWSSQRTIFPNLLTYWSMQTLKKYILYKMLYIWSKKITLLDDQNMHGSWYKAK